VVAPAVAVAAAIAAMVMMDLRRTSGLLVGMLVCTKSVQLTAS
jgi:hypothetical protein